MKHRRKVTLATITNHSNELLISAICYIQHFNLSWIDPIIRPWYHSIMLVQFRSLVPIVQEMRPNIYLKFLPPKLI